MSDGHELRRTPLHERHVAAGARMVDFAGWSMPVQYTGVADEHRAVREAAGMFDVSHMGEVVTSGAGAEEALQRLLTNDVTQIAPAGAQYSLLCDEEGGVLDDLITYRLAGGEYLTVTNAANHAGDLAWMKRHGERDGVRVEDAASSWAMIAVQGPAARAAVASLADGELPARHRSAPLALAGVAALVCGTGYTGEDGVEILCPPQGAVALWDALDGAGVKPAGLAARDTLRLEACLHLYGNELTRDRHPIEAGLGWCCKEPTGFIGAQAVARERAAGPRERLVAFAIEGAGIARKGNPVRGGGVVTSGTMSPTLGVGIGMAYVPAARAAVGERIEIDVRGKMRPAVIKERPLYRKAA
ncbi:MAG TPA: glycine cleavage system aminomethyltransferase GcvT [Solirubrobacteraceae bacterium]|nr:glycine cleavage system aminomethyltransferase GcvT [Solirubrobacteraceae bacterium]